MTSSGPVGVRRVERRFSGRIAQAADATRRDDGDADRVTYDDDVFLRTHRVLGLEVASQMVWRFDVAPSAEQVEALHARLAAGPLSRLAQRGHWPLERARWCPADVVAPVRWDGVLASGVLGDEPFVAGSRGGESNSAGLKSAGSGGALSDAVESGAVDPGSPESEGAESEGAQSSDVEQRMAWVAEVARGLDPEHGPPWRLAWVALSDGGALVSLAVSHAVADGAAMAQAVVAAVEGVALGRVPSLNASGGVVRRQLGGVVASPAPGARTDSTPGEVAGRLGAIARGVGAGLRRAVAAGLVSPAGGAARRRPSAPVVDEPVIDVTRPARVAAFVIDRDAWRRAAETRGGSENSLFIAVVTAVAAHGETRPDVIVPVSDRAPGDLRSNDSSGVRVALSQPVSERDDLRAVRADTGSALRARRDGTGPDPLAPWKPLIQALPDVVVRRLVGEAPGPRCLASSMGEAPASLVALFGRPAEAVLMNAVTNPVAGSGLGARHHLGGAVSAWWSATPKTVTMTLAVTDDVIAPDVEALAQRVSDELRAWGLTSRRW